MSALLTMTAVAILTTFTACSDDDDPVTEVTTPTASPACRPHTPTFSEEIEIENAFRSALGITRQSSSPRKVR